MSRLEDLINELCPNGVEYKKIQEVCDVTTDYTAAGSFGDIAKNVKYNSNPDFAQLVRTMDLKSNFTSKNQVFVDEHAFKYLWRVNLDKESLILPNIGNCGEVYYIKPNDLPYPNNVLGPNAILVRSSSINNRFLFHLFQGEDFQFNLNKITSTTGQGKYNKTDFRNIEIPVPPIPIQEEIVRILDNFTELTAELTAELQDRKRQYDYYSESLLTFNDSVERVKLKDLCSLITKGTTPHDFETSGINFIKTEAFSLNGIDKNKLAYISEETHNFELKRSILKENDILIAIAGSLGKSIIITKEMLPANTNQALAIVRLNNPKMLKYVYYIMISNQMKKYIASSAKGSAQPNLTLKMINDFEIPLPSLQEQERIVSILDKFDKYCNDISEGLPAEIKYRQQQYEYYRDKLLSFKRIS